MSKFKMLIFAGFAAATFWGFAPDEAEAASCYYYARTADGAVFARGRAFARKESTACRRARRECNRQLGWKVIRHGQPSGLRPCTELRLGHDDEGEPRPPKRTNGGPSKPRPNTSKPPSSR